MHSIHLKTTVGSDGVLRVQLPPEYQEQELEAIVILELLPKGELANPLKTSGWQPGFFEEVVGGWVGEPLVRENQGDYEVRENLF
ncbi:hypothetical protein J0895_13060 [Phormidium pseudopriestleyi FRX01]|uniref:Uncharacterized protein n=1 Tax=Phormidium pseudopriestleyi FRX01 TaxID=1759528 RepID=A0ABS3FSC4_9CYAN|nr:hypothetical protein [Phormidium pseudopriestleyi]MBO0350024.1 hypothetical protein [Phormidium pseudopriestleyi FRX01]